MGPQHRLDGDLCNYEKRKSRERRSRAAIMFYVYLLIYSIMKDKTVGFDRRGKVGNENRFKAVIRQH